MSDIDAFSRELFECSKRFLERAEALDGGGADQQAYLRSALLNGCCYLESIVNHVCDHFSNRRQFEVVERALLMEREVEIHRGTFRVGKKDKFYRLDDRLSFLLRRFQEDFDPDNLAWWGQYRDAVNLRNDLAHPREGVTLEVRRTQMAIRGILEVANYLTTAVFSRPLPYYNMGLSPKYDY